MASTLCFDVSASLPGGRELGVENVADISETHWSKAAPAKRRAAGAWPLAEIPVAAWNALAERAIEPNAYAAPPWLQAIAASVPGNAAARALTAWDGSRRLIGLVPVLSLWQAYRLPLPGLVNVDPHNSLGTPLFSQDDAVAAVTTLLREARAGGAHALLLRHVTIAGPMMHALREALAREGLEPVVSDAHERAFLDARGNGETVLQSALGAKKLKQLRRQRNRLAEHGEVSFAVARTADEVADALPAFLDLEASGWKGARGTALKQHDGTLAFIRRATRELAAQGRCELVSLRAGQTPVAAGIVLRHLRRAYYFKIGVDPSFAKLSVGVQLTLELTRHLCADPAITTADSTADPGHPMIDPIWRDRLAIGDVLVPLRRYDPLFSVIRFALFARRHARKWAMRALGR